MAVRTEQRALFNLAHYPAQGIHLAHCFSNVKFLVIIRVMEFQARRVIFWARCTLPC